MTPRRTAATRSLLLLMTLCSRGGAYRDDADDDDSKAWDKTQITSSQADELKKQFKSVYVGSEAPPGIVPGSVSQTGEDSFAKDKCQVCWIKDEQIFNQPCGKQFEANKYQIKVIKVKEEFSRYSNFIAIWRGSRIHSAKIKNIRFEADKNKEVMLSGWTAAWEYRNQYRDEIKKGKKEGRLNNIQGTQCADYFDPRDKFTKGLLCWRCSKIA